MGELGFWGSPRFIDGCREALAYVSNLDADLYADILKTKYVLVEEHELGAFSCPSWRVFAGYKYLFSGSDDLPEYTGLIVSGYFFAQQIGGMSFYQKFGPGERVLLDFRKVLQWMEDHGIKGRLYDHYQDWLINLRENEGFMTQ